MAPLRKDLEHVDVAWSNPARTLSPTGDPYLVYNLTTSLEFSQAAVQGHTAPTREDLEHADAGMVKPGKDAGPSGRPGDPYTQGEHGIDRNAGLGQFPAGDPANTGP